jgi:hypothetical protein
MKSVFDDYADKIRRIAGKSRMSRDMSLMLLGMLTEAYTHGALTFAECDALSKQVDADYAAKYAEQLELAAHGDLATDRDREPVAGVYG